MILNLRIKNVQINFDSWILPLIKAESCVELKTKTTTTTNVLPFFETWNVSGGIRARYKMLSSTPKKLQESLLYIPYAPRKINAFSWGGSLL